MKQDGLILITQIDHMTGEDIGQAMEALNHPAIGNRNLISTMTKKGRMGYLLFLDLEPEAETEIGRLLFETFGTHGYHRIQTQHVSQETVIEEIDLVIERGQGSIRERIRLKRRKEQPSGPYFMESDDLFRLHKRFQEAFGHHISPQELRRRIESQASGSKKDFLKILV
jgi:uncharacterized protein (DUF111 family)